MPAPFRAEVHKFAGIPAAPDVVWGLITDWAGMLRWWLTAEEGGLCLADPQPLVSTSGGRSTAIPKLENCARGSSRRSAAGGGT